MECNIFNIQKFSVSDGPGIRTTVFMKGCPLKCLWCHNPESGTANPEIFYNEEKCILCGRCQNFCKEGCHVIDKAHAFNRKMCNACGECTRNCISGALEIIGKTMKCEDIVEEVLKDKMFYDASGGGVTLSGGEPMFQHEATYEILRLAKREGIHTAVETCGYAEKESFEKVYKLVDLFLFDYKESDPVKHRDFTGVSNELILNNLEFLNEMGADIILRCPLIPTLNDNENHIHGIWSTANRLKNIKEIHILPYHPLGVGKRRMLGKEAVYKESSFAQENHIRKIVDKIRENTDKLVKKA